MNQQERNQLYISLINTYASIYPTMSDGDIEYIALKAWRTTKQAEAYYSQVNKTETMIVEHTD